MLEFRNHALPDFRLHFRDLCPINAIPGQGCRKGERQPAASWLRNYGTYERVLAGLWNIYMIDFGRF